MYTKQAEILLSVLREIAEEKAHAAQGPFIHVSEAISTAAFLYERVRNLIDFRAEHLLRKAAVQRILVRRFKFMKQREGLAEALVRELIRARHLPNDRIPESRVRDVQAIILKYQTVIDLLNAGRLTFDERADWLIEMCAVELEELFSPKDLEHAMVQIFYESIKDRVACPNIDQQTREFQLYVAAYKTLRKSDVFMTQFHLLRLYYPAWFEVVTTVGQTEVDQLLKSRAAILAQLEQPIGRRFLAQARKVVAPFIVLETLIREQAENIPALINHPEDFATAVTQLIEKKYKENADRLWRRGVRALIYIFLTKIVIGVLLELPYDIWIVKDLRWMPLIVNMAFPPILLGLILSSLKQPGKANTELLVTAINEVVYANQKPLVFSGVKRISLKKKGVALAIYTTLYLALFGISYGAIATVLSQVGFNVVSIVLFLLFTSIVSFFGVNLRQSARELIIVAGRENLRVVFFNALTLPILTVGRWISNNVNRINIFLFVLDVLVEAPFQFLIEVLESWLDFLREKKEEI